MPYPCERKTVRGGRQVNCINAIPLLTEITHVDIITAEPSKRYPFAEVKPNPANGIHSQRLIMHETLAYFNLLPSMWINTFEYIPLLEHRRFWRACSQRHSMLRYAQNKKVRSASRTSNLLQWSFTCWNGSSFSSPVRAKRAGPLSGRRAARKTFPWQKVGLTDWRDIL